MMETFLDYKDNEIDISHRKDEGKMTEPTIDQLAIISYKDGHWKYGYVTEIYKQGYVLKMENGGKTLREYIEDESTQSSENNKSLVEVLLLTDRKTALLLLKGLGLVNGLLKD